MDKEHKNRSGSQSGSGSEGRGDAKKTSQPGGPSKSNRQTGGSNRSERDDSNGGPEKNTTKRGANSV